MCMVCSLQCLAATVGVTRRATHTTCTSVQYGVSVVTVRCGVLTSQGGESKVS